MKIKHRNEPFLLTETQVVFLRNIYNIKKYREANAFNILFNENESVIKIYHRAENNQPSFMIKLLKRCSNYSNQCKKIYMVSVRHQRLGGNGQDRAFSKLEKALDYALGIYSFNLSRKFTSREIRLMNNFKCNKRNITSSKAVLDNWTITPINYSYFHRFKVENDNLLALHEEVEDVIAQLMN